MKKIMSIIAMFILSMTLSTVPVEAKISHVNVMLVFEEIGFTRETPSGNEQDIMKVFNKTMGDSFEMILASSDNHEGLYFYTLIPKEMDILYMAEEAYEGDRQALEDWGVITAELREVSVYIHNHASMSNDNKYAIMIFNPESYEYFIWMAFDGEVVYDYFHDISDADRLFQ